MNYDIKLIQKHTLFTVFSIEKMKTVPTKTLLKIYKSMHSYTLYEGYYGEVNPVDEHVWAYKAALKKELNTREHVPKKKPNSRNPNRKMILLRKRIKNQKIYLLSDLEIRRLYEEKTILILKTHFPDFRLAKF